MSDEFERPPFTPDEAAKLLAGYHADADIGRALRGLVACGGALRERDERIAALTAERDAAMAIIAGRTTPPTDEEIAVHHAAGGEWLGFREDVRTWCHGPEVVSFTYSEEHERSARRCSRFWALDAEGRPCAWPVVEAKQCE